MTKFYGVISHDNPYRIPCGKDTTDLLRYLKTDLMNNNKYFLGFNNEQEINEYVEEQALDACLHSRINEDGQVVCETTDEYTIYEVELKIKPLKQVKKTVQISLETEEISLD